MRTLKEKEKEKERERERERERVRALRQATGERRRRGALSEEDGTEESLLVPASNCLSAVCARAESSCVEILTSFVSAYLHRSSSYRFRNAALVAFGSVVGSTAWYSVYVGHVQRPS